eukprot:gene14914-20063_t
MLKRPTKKYAPSAFFRYAIIAIFISYTIKRFISTDIKLNILLNMYDTINWLFDNATEDNTYKNLYLQGNFAPVYEENFNIPMQLLSGKIPNEIEGLYLRVGSNPLPKSESRRYHWFDGHGMIHAVRVKNGLATYTNQWIETPRYLIEKRWQRPVFMLLGEIRGLIGLFKVLFLAPTIVSLSNLTEIEIGTANTAITIYKDRIFSGVENSLPFEIQWNENNTFSSIGFENLNGSLNHGVSAHIRPDPEDGQLYFNYYEVAKTQPTVFTGTINNNNLATDVSIDMDVKPWIHDMMITKNYMLQFESSIQFDKNGIFEGVFFKFNKNHKLKIGVTPKNATISTDIIWFEFDKPYGIVHAFNAWEEINTKGEETIVFWTPMCTNFDGSLETADNKFPMYRIIMNLKTGDKSVDVIDDTRTAEFPRVHPSFIGRPAQFGYASQFNSKSRMFDQIIKYDLFAGKILNVISYENGTWAGEAVPVRMGGQEGQKSDDVYLSVFTFTDSTQASEWRLYNGKTMDPIPVVRMSLGGKRVPYGFHGEWIPENVLSRHMSLSRQKHA